MKMTDERLRLQWGPKDLETLQGQVRYLESVIDDLNDNLDATSGLISHMRACIDNAPCLVSRPGELTYECRHDSPCRVCKWRNETMQSLREEWHINFP
jgi:hypothetical protein